MSSRLADLPPLENGGPIVSNFEFMPAWAFYAPLVPHILKLAVRHGGLTTLCAANPTIPGGGLVGESKAQVLNMLTGPSRDLAAPFILVLRQQEFDEACLKEDMAAKNLSFPLVAKPDISCRGAGIRIVRTLDAVKAYWQSFPPGEKFLLQELVDLEPEAGIFYIRDPVDDRPQIFSLTLKYTPTVLGDGSSTLRQLIKANPRASLAAETYFNKPGLDLEATPALGERIKLSFAGNHCRGSVFRDGAQFITPELTAAMDMIARSMSGFHFGRLDVRFETLEQLKQGKGFRIIEINGVGSEATHIWDNRAQLSEARNVLRQQYTHAFEIGAIMRAQGNAPLSLLSLLKMWWREKRLTRYYPISD